jgi:hypothetical protein
MFYYNIGKTASGGDNLSANPNRIEIIENIRKGLVKRHENMSEEDKVKFSNSLKGEGNPNYGNKWNVEQRERMSKQRKGKPSILKGKSKEEVLGKERADAMKKMLSEKGKKLIGDKNPFYGKQHSDEIKRYTKECNLLHFIKVGKPFKINDKNYMFIKDASDDLGVHAATITYRLKSKNFINYEYITDTELIEKIKDENILNVKNRI